MPQTPSGPLRLGIRAFVFEETGRRPGATIEAVAPSTQRNDRTGDFLIDEEAWGLKGPRVPTDGLSPAQIEVAIAGKIAVEAGEARGQADSVVIDIGRQDGLNEEAIRRELMRWMPPPIWGASGMP